MNAHPTIVARGISGECGLVEISEVVDRETLAAYLNGQPHEVAQVIAARAALRVWPLLVFNNEWVEYPTVLIFTGQQANLISCVAPVRSFSSSVYNASYATYVTNKAADLGADAADTVFFAVHAAANAAAAAANAANVVYEFEDAPSIAADAVDAATVAASFFEDEIAHKIWQNARIDLELIAVGKGVQTIVETALWEVGDRGPFEAEWQELKTDLRARDEGWEVWFPIYERFRDGVPQNWDMLERIALIPDEDWTEGDPAHLNGIIAGIVGEFEGAKSVATPPNDPVDLEILLNTRELRAALADFDYDGIYHLMKMIPFEGEVKEFGSLDSAKRRQDMLDELCEGLGDLVEDIRDAQKNIPPYVLKSLERYIREAERDLQDVRFGRLWDIGANIHFEAFDENTIFALGDGLSGALQRMAEKHLDLMRQYFASTVERMQGADELQVREGVEFGEAFDAMADAVREIESPTSEVLPPLDKEDVGIVKDKFDELERIKENVDRTSDPALREAALKRYWRSFKTLTSTIVRYSLKAGKFGKKAGDVGVWGHGVWDLLMKLFQNWPF